MKSNFRRKVFKRAYEIQASTGKAFAICLSKAWNIYRLVQKMRSQITDFAFKKADGTIRQAKGIIKTYMATSTKVRKENFKSVSFFDAEIESFRSFKVENLITII